MGNNKLWSPFIVLLSASLVVSVAEAVKVNFQGAWRRGVGWELVCSWSFAGGDHLQSTRLFRAGLQFLIYRPDIYGSKLEKEYTTEDSVMRVVCIEQEAHRGVCVLTVAPTRPPASLVEYTCEVSGERPLFLMVTKHYDVEGFVKAEDTRIEAHVDNDNMSNRVLLNCTATGIPAPVLVWTVDDQIVPTDFSGSFWNSTMKSEQVWSSLSVSPMDSSAVLAVCTPEQVTYKKTMTTGRPAEYLISSANGFHGKYCAAIFVAIIKLLR